MQDLVLQDLSLQRDYLCGMARYVDYGDLYAQVSQGTSVELSDGKLEEVSTYGGGGCGVRLLMGKNTVFSAHSGVGIANFDHALEESRRVGAISVVPLDVNSKDASSVLRQPEVVAFGDMSRFVELDRILRKESGLVKQVTIAFSSSARNLCILNTQGHMASDARRYVSFSVHVALEGKGRIETGCSSRSASGDVGLFLRSLDLEEIGFLALNEALRNMSARACPTGQMPVVLSGLAGGTIIHEACGHGMEADIVFEEESVFAPMMGHKVAPEFVSIVDNPRISNLYGSYDIDDEGTPSSPTTLVENGVLKAFLSDRRTSMLYDIPLTGNGRRESYRALPIPRMSNTYVVAGDGSEGSMLEGMTRGILIKGMGGGEVNPTSGDFMFEVTEGYLVEKGQVVHPIRGASLIGNCMDALEGIRAVGDCLHFESGTCEKDGQGVPVTDAQPSLLIEGLVIGGTSI